MSGVQKDLVRGEHCRSLRHFRNKQLAHGDTRGAEQTARYGHEVALLEALPSVPPPDFEPAKMIWDYEANRFWTALITGVEGTPKTI